MGPWLQTACNAVCCRLWLSMLKACNTVRYCLKTMPSGPFVMLYLSRVHFPSVIFFRLSGWLHVYFLWPDAHKFTQSYFLFQALNYWEFFWFLRIFCTAVHFFKITIRVSVTFRIGEAIPWINRFWNSGSFSENAQGIRTVSIKYILIHSFYSWYITFWLLK